MRGGRYRSRRHRGDVSANGHEAPPTSPVTELLRHPPRRLLFESMLHTVRLVCARLSLTMSRLSGASKLLEAATPELNTPPPNWLFARSAVEDSTPDRDNPHTGKVEYRGA
ncbi:hypothetical protein cyc_05366 [Cyclospora cayetanensis]|uniref:Uncharacterized protein n=1 Tax=Cyclospora cayetanensis TaxID=88456 RepID=A0A1D3D391_9EIME|nr:hypothetical protein cyc_05366 [Cyclospora cayetanensis]